MRAVIQYIVRKSRGGQSIREATAESEVLVGGRGNDCGLHLPDPRVLLRHVEFAVRGGAIYVSALSGGDLRIGGNLTEGGKVAPGQSLRVGPYEITIEPPRADADLVLAVELVKPLADDLDQLAAAEQIAIPRIGLSVRGWSWLAVFVIACAALLTPMVLNFVAPPGVGARALDPAAKRPPDAPTQAWSSGPVSAPHRFFGNNCATCHTQPFMKVADSACTACHTAVGYHTDMVTRAAIFTRTRCQDCHKEHRGVAVTLDDQDFCASCHSRLEAKAPNVGLHNVSDFAVDHPEFHPTVIADPVTMRVSRASSVADTPQQHIGLKFPHDKHLMVEGVRDGSGAMIHLACANCHTSDAGGVAMRPVNFERDCHVCHQLKFDRFIPDRELLHGRPEDVAKQVRDVYGALALQGGYEEPEAPQIVRRRPGAPLTTEEKKVVGDWAQSKSAAVLAGRFGKGLCAECHDIVDAPQGASIDWSVAPMVLVAAHFPKARFSHAKHANTDCRFCHAAQASNSATEVLMPSIKTCRSCHGQETAANRVPSTCFECHDFHQKQQPVLRETAAPAGAPKAAKASLAP